MKHFVGIVLVITQHKCRLCGYEQWTIFMKSKLNENWSTRVCFRVFNFSLLFLKSSWSLWIMKEKKKKSGKNDEVIKF